MRTRLLDATIERLVTYGYAGTTTPPVAELAGVTRGARFTTSARKKNWWSRRSSMGRSNVRGGDPRVRALQASSDPVSTVLEFLWEAHEGPMFVATVDFGSQNVPIDCWPATSSGLEPVVNSTLISVIAELVPDHALQKSCAASSTPRWTHCGASC